MDLVHPVIEHVRRQNATARSLSFALLGLGLVELIACLVLRVPAIVTGLGFTLMAGGGLALLRVKRVESAFRTALEHPEQVLQLARVNVTLKVHGATAGTYDTVVVVFESGLHASLQATALVALRSAFPDAAIADGRDAFDRFDTRSRAVFIGTALVSLFAGLLGAVVVVTPSVNAELARTERWHSAERATRALVSTAISSVDTSVTSPWGACGDVRLEGEVPIKLEGLGSEGFVGTLTVAHSVSLMEPFPLPRPRGRASVTVDLLTGSGASNGREPAVPQFAIVGRAVKNGLVLRLVNAAGERVCEGLAPTEQATGNAVTSDDEAAAVVMLERPFCSQLAPTACATLAPLPAAPSEAAQGSLARDAIQAVIRKDATIRKCFDQALVRHRDVKGKLTIGFTIGTQGTVTSADVRASTVDDQGLEGCVVGRVKRFVFPKPKGGVVAVTYPFVFAQQ